MEGSLGQKLNRHEFSLVSASKLPFSKESNEAATATARFVVESGTAHLKFHYEAELSNVVVRVDLRSAQVFELGPVESICVDEGSDGGENEKYLQKLKSLRSHFKWHGEDGTAQRDKPLYEVIRRMVIRSQSDMATWADGKGS